MKRLLDFAKTTLIGGLLVVVPIYLIVLLVAKAFAKLFALLSPITAEIPARVEYRQAAAILIVFGVCFIAGLIVRTALGRRAVQAFERTVLAKIPGYTALRGLTNMISGTEGETAFLPALVEIEEALAPAFIIEELPDGRFTVMIPSVPTPAAGSLFILPPERVHRVDMPFRQALRVFSTWGTGAGEMARRIPGPPPTR